MSGSDTYTVNNNLFYMNAGGENITGTNATFADPKFADLINKDYRLGKGSPALGNAFYFNI